jgi:Holliday junction resolvase RusA-like endonuclease
MRSDPVIYSGFVKGDPYPQGSMQIFSVKGTPRAVQPRKLRVWRDLVAWTVAAEKPKRAEACPVGMILSFTQRPIVNAPKGSPEHCASYDLDKLVRAVFDALQGVAYVDDRQVIDCAASKRVSKTKEPGCFIRVWAYEEGE